MGKIVKSIFGGGEKPKASPAPQEDLKENKKEAASQRRRLFETEGEEEGQELSAGGVRRRNTLLGN